MNYTDISTMKMGVLRVREKKNSPLCLDVVVRHACIADFGFVHKKSVLVTYQHDGFTVVLCDNADANSDGRILHIGGCGNIYRLSVRLPKNSIFSNGDFLAVKYEHGIITARKLPSAQRYYVVGLLNHDAYLKMSGYWLSDIGFTPDTTVTVSTVNGCILFNAWMDTSKSYRELVRFSRKNKYQIIQIRKNEIASTLEIPCYLFNRVGITSGDIIGVHYGYGRIKFFKPGLENLGL